MTAASQAYPNGLNAVDFAYDGSIAVAVGDCIFHDTNDAKPFSSKADLGTEAANVAAIAPLFAGVALERKTTSSAAGTLTVSTDWVGYMDCTSATFEVGDLVTADEDSGGTFMSNQLLLKTTDETLAIGRVLKREASAVTRVLVRLTSRVLPPVAAFDTSAQLASATLPVLIFNGATGANEIQLPANLADALSIEDSTGDLMTFDTTTGTLVVNFGASVRVNVAGDFQGGSATTDLVAFHGSTPTDQCGAYTQTFSTAGRTHSARTAVDLTDNSAGTPADTITALADGSTWANDVASARNNFASLARTCDRLIVDLANTAGIVNALVDDLQEKGLVG